MKTELELIRREVIEVYGNLPNDIIIKIISIYTHPQEWTEVADF